MKRISKKWFAILGIPLALGVAAWAQGPKAICSFGEMHGMLKPERIHQIIDWRVNDVLDEIDATSEQRAAIHDLKERVMDEFVNAHREMESAHETLLTQWKSDSPDPVAIDAAIDSSVQVKAKMAKQIAHDIAVLHGILTPAQREILTEKMEAHTAFAHDFLKSR